MDFVVSGKLKIFSQKVGEKKIVQDVLNPNDLVIYQPSEAHALVALKDTVFITFAKGPRGGEQYESDTYRLEKPLQE